jgi:hypothetical protein
MHDCTPQTPCVATTQADAEAKTIANPNLALIQEQVTVNASDTPIEPVKTDDCLYCAALSVEMKKRAEPTAQVIQTYAAIDLMVMAAPLALGGGMTSLGLDAAES